MNPKITALLCVLALPVCAARAQAEDEADGDSLTGAERLAIFEKVQPSLVAVEYMLQYDKGKEPRGGSITKGEGWVQFEKPVEVPGYLVGRTQVLTKDILTEPRFIKSVSVRWGDRLVPARPAAYFIDHRCALLEMDEPIEGTRPLVFDDSAEGPYQMIKSERDQGRWYTSVRPLSITHLRASDSGESFMVGPGLRLVTDSEGTAVGIIMSGRLPLDDSWKGSPLSQATISAADHAARIEKLRAASETGILRVSLRFRSPKKKQGFAGSFSPYGSASKDSETQREAVAVLLDNSTVLVLADLKPNVTARLEKIQLHLPDARTVDASFEYTFSDYGCFVARTPEPLEGAMKLSAADIRDLQDKLLFRRELSVRGEELVSHFWHERIKYFWVGWKRKLYPIASGDDDDLFVFDDEGALLGLPLGRRAKPDAQQRWAEKPRLTPIAHILQLQANLAASVDPSNIPLSEAEENRLAWLGVELQPLNKELARANNVSQQTQEGRTGAIVSYVYPDSPAARAGVEPGFVFLRIHVEDRPKPMEVKADEGAFGGRAFPWDQFDRIPEQYYDQIPKPWPDVENALSRALTDIGFSKKFTAEFVCDGQVVAKEFVVTESPPYYDSAPRHEDEALGLTVRDLTYEVRRYFQKADDDPGVIVSRVEPGSKASVSGIKPYEIITHVNDEPVSNAAEFSRLVSGQAELRLAVNRMTKGRLVRIRMEAAEEADTRPAQ